MNYSDTILKNLKRVDKILEKINLDSEGRPYPSWIEISPIDICNRACVFCPKSDNSIAPNQNQKMPEVLYKKIAKELKDMKYSGTLMIAGYGEPLLNKDVISMCELFSKICSVEITTNGDPLNITYIEELYKAGVSKLIISMYDGEEQINYFNTLFSEANISSEKYILRDRWYKEEDDYGVKLTNRAGALTKGKIIKENKPCYYPSYSMMVDWNGDVFLCTQDWNRRIKTGNLMISTIHEVWTSSFLKRYRQNLNKGKRTLTPCDTCDANGTLHGEKYNLLWNKYYKGKE